LSLITYEKFRYDELRNDRVLGNGKSDNNKNNNNNKKINVHNHRGPFPGPKINVKKKVQSFI